MWVISLSRGENLEKWQVVFIPYMNLSKHFQTLIWKRKSFLKKCNFLLCFNCVLWTKTLGNLLSIFKSLHWLVNVTWNPREKLFFIPCYVSIIPLCFHFQNFEKVFYIFLNIKPTGCMSHIVFIFIDKYFDLFSKLWKVIHIFLNIKPIGCMIHIFSIFIDKYLDLFFFSSQNT